MLEGDDHVIIKGTSPRPNGASYSSISLIDRSMHLVESLYLLYLALTVVNNWNRLKMTVTCE